MADLAIYKEIVSLLARGESMALATVVCSSGSSPRRPGARMLVRRDGSFVGTVGGGAVEYRVCQKAAEVIASGRPQLLHFDLSGQHPESSLPRGRDPERGGDLSHPHLCPLPQGRGAREAVSICGGCADVFVEPITPPETLYIVGAGHVGRAVAAIGKIVGFHVTVIDPRADLNCPDWFPTADRLIVTDYAAGVKQAAFDKNSYVVICTTGHVFDEQCLELAVAGEARYVGMIGSRKKVAEVKKNLLAKGVPGELLDGVRAPIGLKIGAETPEEIAVSIMAEVVAARRAE